MTVSVPSRSHDPHQPTHRQANQYLNPPFPTSRFISLIALPLSGPPPAWFRADEPETLDQLDGELLVVVTIIRIPMRRGPHRCQRERRRSGKGEA
jgi:hypothetical protein